MLKNNRIIILCNVPEWHSLAERAEKLFSKLKGDYSIDYLFRMKSRFRTIIKNIKEILSQRPSIIYVIDIGYSTILPVLICKPLLPFRFLLDTGDVTFELFKSTGRGLFTRIMVRIFEPFVWKVADAIIVRGVYFEEYLRKRGLKNVYFVPDGVDTGLFKPAHSSELRKSLGLDKFITIGMVGTLNWISRYDFCYGWELVSALRYLKDLPVKGVIVGDGSGLDRLKELSKEFNVEDRVVFLGRVPYRALPRYINIMDICLSTQSNDITGMVRTTGKLPLYMACNKYIISTRVGTARYILPEEMVIDYNGVKDDSYPGRLATRIREVISKGNYNSQNLQLDKIARETFDYQFLSEKVRNIIEGIKK